MTHGAVRLRSLLLTNPTQVLNTTKMKVFSLFSLLLAGLTAASAALVGSGGAPTCANEQVAYETFIGKDHNVKVSYSKCDEDASTAALAKRQSSNVCGAACKYTLYTYANDLLIRSLAISGNTFCFTPAGGPSASDCNVIADALLYDSQNVGVLFNVSATGVRMAAQPSSAEADAVCFLRPLRTRSRCSTGRASRTSSTRTSPRWCIAAPNGYARDFSYVAGRDADIVLHSPSSSPGCLPIALLPTMLKAGYALRLTSAGTSSKYLFVMRFLGAVLIAMQAPALVIARRFGTPVEHGQLRFGLSRLIWTNLGQYGCVVMTTTFTP